MNRGIIFDLDGTLVDSLPGIAEGVNRALETLGKQRLSREEVRGMIGRGARNLCAQAIGYRDANGAPAAELEPMHAAFRHCYPSCWRGDFTLPYPGIQEMLRALAGHENKLAVLSNKPHDVTEPMVHELFPGIPFDPVLGFTGKFPRKPAPDALLHIAKLWNLPPHQITLVGDSLYDADTAKNAACRFVAVGWGYARQDELCAASPLPPAQDTSQLLSLLLHDDQPR